MCSLMLTNVPVTSARNRDFPCLITEMSSSSLANFSESIRQSWKWLSEFYFSRYSEIFRSSYFHYCNIFYFFVFFCTFTRGYRWQYMRKPHASLICRCE